MRNVRNRQIVAAIIVSLGAGPSACASHRVPPETIIGLERQALDRWGRGDPEGFLTTYAPDVTYFDPMQPRRVNGLDTMRAMYAPLAGKIHVASYDMIAPLVQGKGDMAVLSYNLVSHGTTPTGEAFAVRWNSSTVYRRTNGEWKIIHSHWSFTTPPNQPRNP